MRVTIPQREAAAADEEPLELEYGGVVYPLPTNLPLDALEAMEKNEIVGFLRACLGSSWRAFKVAFNTADLDELADALAELYGRSLGESGASGAS